MSKRQKIDELNQKLSVLKDHENRLTTETDEWAEKRDKRNEQVKKSRIEISEFKNERDRLNGQVKISKQQRSETKTRIREKISELKDLNRKRRTLIEERPSRSHQTLQRELEDTEWKIQTTSLSLQEEKELVKKVGQLEAQLSIYRKIEETNQKIAGLRVELESLNANGEQCHEKLTTMAQKSQQIHEKMLAKIEESGKTEAEADTLHQAFVQTRDKLELVQKEIADTLKQIRLLRGEVREETEKEKKRNDDALREELEKKAREKLERGEKLSWNEFQLIAEKGLKAQD